MTAVEITLDSTYSGLKYVLKVNEIRLADMLLSKKV